MERKGWKRKGWRGGKGGEGESGRGREERVEGRRGMYLLHLVQVDLPVDDFLVI